MSVLYLTSGRAEEHTENRTGMYLLTLTPDGDNLYRARWDYPNDPSNPNDSGTHWTRQQVAHNIARGIWTYRYPPVLDVPTGA